MPVKEDNIFKWEKVNAVLDRLQDTFPDSIYETEEAKKAAANVMDEFIATTIESGINGFLADFIARQIQQSVSNN